MSSLKRSVRIAHCSDLHYCPRHLAEVSRCFDFAVDAAIGRAVDCAVISGDSTDHALDMHAPAAESLARAVRRLAEHCPVLMLQGTYSHEPPGTLSLFRLLGGKHRVFVADRICQVALREDGSWLASERYRFDTVPNDTRVLFSCLPTVNKAAVAGAVGATVAAEVIGEHVAALLRGFAVTNERAAAIGVPTVGVSHGTVNGCVTEHGVPLAGLDHEFTSGSLFDARASAFLLGHIHKHQVWEQHGRLVAYPGSIGRLHYGEEGDKGFIVWQVHHDRASLEFIATPAKRTLEIEFDGAPNLDELRELAARAAGHYVRVRWTIAEEDRASVDRAAIEAIFKQAEEVKLEGRVIPMVRTRAAGIATASTLAERIDRWAAAVGVNGGPLAARMTQLAWLSSDEIAERLLAADRPVEATTAETMIRNSQDGANDAAVETEVTGV